MKLLRGKLTYANVVSTLCLFLLVAGGTAFAASQLGKNTVGPKQLKRNAVTAAKIMNGAVTASKLSPNLKTQGAPGPQGAPGKNGNANVVTYSLGSHDFSSDQFFTGRIPGLDGVAISKGTWSAQLVGSDGIEYPVPGTGNQDKSTYRAYLEGGDKPTLNVIRSIGPGEKYQNVLFTWIAASETK